jgi:NAD(P)-dependent dehydrogenase (short-subunit alcohol dehydrogenase family)
MTADREFDGKVAIVTGGAKGIGGATAQAFLHEGASVAVLDLDTRTPAFLDNLPQRSMYVETDVSKGTEVASAIKAVAERFGGIDVLVNNAGIQRYNAIADLPEEEWDFVLGVNLKSAFLCSKFAIPEMKKRGRGVIVNMASVQAFVTQQNVAAYATSKTAILGLTRSIAVDYAPAIRCVAVCPGTVDTPMLRDAIRLSPNPEQVLQECIEMHPLGRIATPDEIANLILYLCSDRAGFITGQYFRIDGGLGLEIGGSRRA